MKTTRSKPIATTTEPTKTLPADLQTALDEAQTLLYRDRRRAHETLFGGASRKTHSTPEFHWEMIDDFHNPLIQFLLQIGFRGSSKTTRGEEGLVIRGLFREFRYCLIGSSVSDIAQMRLHAIKRQFETNESLLEIFGNLKTKTWGDEQIELSTGVVFRAIGRGQALRGTKDEDVRPDFIWLDDIEDKKAVATETQIKKTLEWFDGELIGSVDRPNLVMRITANDMGPDCLANKLARSSQWVTKRYPWIVDGKSIWQDRYPLAQSLVTKTEMYARGSGDEYEREFMCNSTRPEAKTFRDEFLKIEDRVRVYEPVHAMIVPAPISESALRASPCAVAAWSWIGEKCIVWECSSRNLQTHEIVAEAKRIDGEYQPVKLGFDKAAFDAWANAQLTLPSILPLKAATDEHEFIRAMQPTFVEKKIIFAHEHPGAWAQFLTFPNGQIDAATALAFALHPDMRWGMIFYKDFSMQNVAGGLEPQAGPMMLALNASDSHVAAALCQVGGSGFRVFADWMSTQPTADAARDIIQEANLLAERRCSVIMPFTADKTKLKFQSDLRRMGLQIGTGGDVGEGRREFYRMLREQSKGLPRLLVNDQARWTRNGFFGGCTINGTVGPFPVLMEALESLASLAAIGADDARTNATSRDGRDFFSARPMVKHG